MCKAIQDMKEEAKQEGRQEGRQEGKQEGKRLGRQEGALNQAVETSKKLHQMGMSIADIAHAVSYPIEMVKDWLKPGAAKDLTLF